MKLINIEEQDLQEAMFITILEVSELFLHTGRMNTLSTILEVIKLILHTGEVPIHIYPMF